MIQPIVEGFAEVESVPVLLRRLTNLAGADHVKIGSPIRKSRPDMIREYPLRRVVDLARRQPGCRALLVLFDGDDDCPREMAPTIQRWAEDAAGGLACAVVMAHREYEAWFLAAIESLVQGSVDPADLHYQESPESHRDAKGILEKIRYAESSYHETADQPALTAQFDLAAAYRRSRSFRRMTTAFGALLRAEDVTLAEWPPAQWLL